MKAQGAGATAVADEPTHEQDQIEPQESAAAKPTSERLRNLLGDTGLPEDVVTTAVEEDAGEPEEEEQLEPEHEEEQPPEAAKPNEDEQEQQKDQEEEKPVPVEWPKSAKARVAEEADKRRKANDRAKKAEDSVTQLQAQLRDAIAQRANAPAAVPAATADDPFNDCLTEAQLNNAVKEWEQIERIGALATTHPDGIENVLVGTDADGKEDRRDFTGDQLANMALESAQALRRVNEKRKWIIDRDKEIAAAKTAYPDLFKQGTPEFQQGVQALFGDRRLTPFLLKVPNIMMTIGDAIAGRKLREEKAAAAAKGKGKDGQPLGEAARRIKQQPDVKKAPAATKTREVRTELRGGTRGGNETGVDTKEAETRAIEAGLSEQSLEELTRNIRAGYAKEQAGEEVLV